MSRLTRSCVLFFIPLLLASGFFLSCKGSAKTQLRVVHFGGSDFPETFNRATEKWRKEHPEVKILLEYVPWGNYTQKILTELAGGSSADAMWVENSHATALVPRGALMPLNGFLEKDSSVRVEDYWPAIIDRFTRDGKLYALPSDVAPIASVYYNKNFFDIAGIPYPSDDWDWDDFLQIAKKLTIRNPDGSVKQWGFFTTHWDNFVYSAGGRMVDNVKDPRKCMLGSADSIAGLQFFFDLAFKHKVMPAVQSGGDLADMSPEQMFIFKKAAMVMSGIWFSGNFNRSITEFEWDIALMPRAPGKKNAVVATGGSGWGVLAFSKHPDLAWELVKIMTGPEVLTKLSEETYQPALIELSKSPDVWCKFPPHPKNKAALNKAMENVVFTPFTPIWWEVNSKVIDPEFQKIWEQKASVREAAARIVAGADPMLREGLQ